MGRMRSSNWEDALNFHFLMIVQMIAVPPTTDAITMSTVNVVRLILDDDDEAAAVDEADASDASVVTVTLGVDMGTIAVVGRVVLGAAVVRGATETEEDVDDDAGADELEDELLLELVDVKELTMLLKRLEVDDDDVVEVEEEEVVLETAGLLEELEVELVDVTLALAPLELPVGGLFPAPLTGTRGVPSALAGTRFLISRLRLTWSRR